MDTYFSPGATARRDKRQDLLYSGRLDPTQAVEELAKIQTADPGLMGRTVEEQSKIKGIVSANPWLATLLEHQTREGGAGGGDEPYRPEWYGQDWIASGVNPALHGGRMLGWLQEKAAHPEEQFKEIAQRYNANPLLPGAFPETLNRSWGKAPLNLAVDAGDQTLSGIPTPAGPAAIGIRTLRGGRPGLVVSYSPEQVAQQQATGLNLVGSPFEWNAGNTDQLNAEMAQRFNALANAEYLRRKGQADISVANAAEAGKLAMYDPQRMETERLLEAGRQNPSLWAMPEFKQKVGIPLTGPEKLAMVQAAHPGLDVAGGLKQLTEGYAPGTSGLARFFDASRFGMAPLSPGEKLQRALESMPADKAEEWRRVAEVMGLLNPVNGRPSRPYNTGR